MNYGFTIVFVLLICLMFVLLYNCAYILHKSRQHKIRPINILHPNPMHIEIVTE